MRKNNKYDHTPFQLQYHVQKVMTLIESYKSQTIVYKLLSNIVDIYYLGNF